ncbi:MAG: hypothetical protein Q8S33_13815 [Myxococcales bacterium]|nr:hypothetical protein [Myxococcales bacterium]MDP3501417.1 hypothetical protein [Myxococcales bacterium]
MERPDERTRQLPIARERAVSVPPEPQIAFTRDQTRQRRHGAGRHAQENRLGFGPVFVAGRATIDEREWIDAREDLDQRLDEGSELALDDQREERILVWALSDPKR